jgi:hypothetical protein
MKTATSNIILGIIKLVNYDQEIVLKLHFNLNVIFELFLSNLNSSRM